MQHKYFIKFARQDLLMFWSHGGKKYNKGGPQGWRLGTQGETAETSGLGRLSSWGHRRGSAGGNSWAPGAREGRPAGLPAEVCGCAGAVLSFVSEGHRTSVASGPLASPRGRSVLLRFAAWFSFGSGREGHGKCSEQLRFAFCKPLLFPSSRPGI